MARSAGLRNIWTSFIGRDSDVESSEVSKFLPRWLAIRIMNGD